MQPSAREAALAARVETARAGIVLILVAAAGLLGLHRPDVVGAAPRRADRRRALRLRHRRRAGPARPRAGARRALGVDHVAELEPVDHRRAGGRRRARRRLAQPARRPSSRCRSCSPRCPIRAASRSSSAPSTSPPASARCWPPSHHGAGYVELVPLGARRRRRAVHLAGRAPGAPGAPAGRAVADRLADRRAQPPRVRRAPGGRGRRPRPPRARRSACSSSTSTSSSSSTTASATWPATRSCSGRRASRAETLRPTDVLARLGGDEFAVIVGDAGPRRDAGRPARLVTALAERAPATAGFACCPRGRRRRRHALPPRRRAALRRQARVGPARGLGSEHGQDLEARHRDEGHGGQRGPARGRATEGAHAARRSRSRPSRARGPSRSPRRASRRASRSST